MLKKRDAQQLSTSVIILAVLGLIVLVVMIFIFSTESGDAVKTLKTCAAKGGVCEDSCDGRTIGDKNELGCTGNTVCCIDI
jgi:hypothetical protein